MTPTEVSKRGPGLVARVVAKLLRPVDVTWLAAFRVLYGVALAISMLRFLTSGWIERFFVEPSFHFKYWGFESIEPLSSAGMHALFVVLTLLAVFIALGFAFRLAATAFAAGLTYIQLIDVSTYLNHYYLAALLGWLLCVSPAHRAFSVDAWLKRRFKQSTEPAQIASAWLYLFRLQVGIVYFFAGLAKAQPDWLIHAQPLRIWLGANADLPVLGPLFTLSWTPLVMSWCGFLFDTTVVGFLLHRRTRPWAYAVVLVFHAFTRVLFPIGMFPVIMALSALVFFNPDWPRKLVSRLGSWLGRPTEEPTPLPLAAPGLPGRLTTPRLLALSLAAAYCALQVLVPLRAFAYGGNVLWHEQGMRFSWRVMVRAKGGNTTFVVRNKETGRTWHVHPRSYLTGLQENEMSSQPDLILQLAHHIHEDFVERGFGPVEVRADSRVALNGRRSARLVDPSIDLVSVRDGLRPVGWVLPAPRQSPPHTRPVL